MAATATTTVGGGQNTFYSKKFLEVVYPLIKLVQFGQKQPLPMGTGKAIQFFRWNALDVSVSGATLTEGANGTATSITAQDISATLAEYGLWVQLSSLMQKSHIDGKISTSMTGIAELLANHAATVIDLKTQYEVAAHAAMPARADAATASTYNGTITGATSTTVFADSDLETNTDYGDANHDLRQS